MGFNNDSNRYSYLFSTIIFVLLSCSKEYNIEEDKVVLIDGDEYIMSQPNNESIAHASNVFTDRNDVNYLVYYSGETAKEERIQGTDINVKLVTFTHPSNILNRKIVLEQGEIVGSFRQALDSSPYDPCLFGIDRFIRIWMVVTPYPTDLKKRGIGYRDYEPNNQLLGSVITCSLKYEHSGQVKTVPLTNENLCIFADEIRGTEIGYHNIGDYPVFNTVKEYNGTLYTVLSFVSSSTYNTLGPIILRSEDNGNTWEYCFSLGDAYDKECIWEVGWDISENGLVYLMTRPNLQPLSHCISFPLEEPSLLKETPFWGNVDASRPFVYCKDDFVYWIHNVYPCLDGISRTRLRIVKTDKELNALNTIDIVKRNGISYFSLFKNQERYYILYTGDSRGTAPLHKGDIAITEVSEIINTL